MTAVVATCFLFNTPTKHMMESSGTSRDDILDGAKFPTNFMTTTNNTLADNTGNTGNNDHTYLNDSTSYF